MERAPDERLGDQALVERARRGDPSAVVELRARHEAAARGTAAHVDLTVGFEDVDVDDAFARAVEVAGSGGGQGVAFRPLLLTVLRRELGTRAARTPTQGVGGDRNGLGTDDADPDDRGAVWAAWRSLPDESRDALWRLVVHGEREGRPSGGPARGAHAAESRAGRAREHLRRALVPELVARAADPSCRDARRRLGGYVRDTLPPTVREQVDDHLDACAACRAGVLDLVDVDAAVRLRVAPMVLPGAFGAPTLPRDSRAETRLTAALVGAAGPAVGLASAAGPPVAASGTEWAADVGAEAGAGPGHVVSVPFRPAVALLAVASLVTAAVLMLAHLDPAGSGGRTEAGRATAAAVTDEALRATSLPPGAAAATAAPRPVIGAATAELVSRFVSSGGRTGSADGSRRPGSRPEGAAVSRATVAAPSAAAVPAPTSPQEGPRTSPPASPVPSRARPTSTGPVPATTSVPTVPTTAPAAPSTTTAPGPPPAAPVGTVTSLSFSPSASRYRAHLEAPAGWSITAVRDVHGGRVVDHVQRPTPRFDGRLRPGGVVVELTREVPDVTGSVVVLFVDGRGRVLPGSGAYPLL